MKKFFVYTLTDAITICADKMGRQFSGSDVKRLIFYRDDVVVAEFYADRICGWEEVENACLKASN